MYYVLNSFSAPREEVLSNTLQFASNSDIVKEVNRTERILKHEIDNMECLLSLYLSSLYEDGNHAIAYHEMWNSSDFPMYPFSFTL